MQMKGKCKSNDQERNERPKTLHMKRYNIGKTIGQGTFGKVKLGTDIRKGNQVAIKIVEKSMIGDEKTMERTRREISILQIISHQNVIQLHEVHENEERIYLVLEYLNGGELFDYVVKNQKLEETVARNIFCQIVDGIDYCHTLGIIHRDLKPENILLDENLNPKIIDFGLSNMLKREGALKSRCGSPYYVAPEMILGKGYGSSVDVWALGIILYCMVTGDVPFVHSSLEGLLQKIVDGQYETPSQVSHDVGHLLSRLLVTDPSKRATLSEIKRHRWISPWEPVADRSFLSLGFDFPLDADILDQMTRAGYEGRAIANALESKSINGMTSMYKMLLWRKRHEGKTMNQDRGNQENEGQSETTMYLHTKSDMVRDSSSQHHLCQSILLNPPLKSLGGGLNHSNGHIGSINKD